MAKDYGRTNVMPYAAAPAVGSAGDIYFDTAAKQLYLSDGTQWLGQAVAAASYWQGNFSGTPASVGSGVWTTLAWTQVLTSNFSLASATNITVGVAGKYRVSVQLSVAATNVMPAWCQAQILQYSSAAVLKATRGVVGAGIPVANYFTEPVVEGLFDAAVGDYFIVQVMPNGTAATVDSSRSWCQVTPVGGAKGDMGPKARVSRGGIYTIPTTAAAMPYDIVDFDPSGMWVPASNGFRAPQAGIYQLSVALYGSTNTVGSNIAAGMRINGTQRAFLANVTFSQAGGGFCTGTTTWQCAANDLIQVFANAGPGSVSTTYADPNNNWACLTYLGP